MVIGGLQIGVTPLDMAHAYETIANDGQLTYGSLSSDVCAGGNIPSWLGTPPPADSCPGPVGVAADNAGRPCRCPQQPEDRAGLPLTRTTGRRSAMMKDVLNPIGTGAAAAIPGVTAWGKTGTTSNYADAWFVGSTAASGSVPSMTVAVWVGYPNSDKSMAKDYGGKPVYGGTYPALIWRQYVMQAIQQYHLEAAERAAARVHKPAPSEHRRRRRAVRPDTTATTGAATPNVPATGATSPASGTVTSGGGISAPATTSPTVGTTAPAGAAGRSRRRIDGGLRAAAGDHPGRWRGGARRRRLGPTGVRRRAAQRASGPTGVSRRARRSGCRATLNRQGSSTAFVIPMRCELTIASGEPLPGVIVTGPSRRSPPLCASSMPSAWVSLPGPEQSSSMRTRPRRSAISSMPSSGSSARISTPAPIPSGSATAFSIAWTP